MSKKGSLWLTVLVLVMILALPLCLSGGKMWDRGDTEDTDDLFGDLFGKLFGSACAEETEKVYSLPVDLFTPGNETNPAGWTYDENGTVTGYEDASIQLRLETRYEDGVSWRIACVTIAHPSQLRTAIAGKKISSDKTGYMTAIARKMNAVVAINGDDYQNNSSAKSFEYRMGQKATAKSNKLRDILIIDENGDMNIFVRSDADKMKQFVTEGHTIVNAFTFGPALIIDGDEIPIPSDYKYNPDGLEPRCAIGQTGTLSYVLVIAEGRNESDSKGVTMEQLADFMLYQLDCVQAYNLDGGNSAEMVVNGEMYMAKKHNERDMNDIIYFASAVDPADWQ